MPRLKVSSLSRFTKKEILRALYTAQTASRLPGLDIKYLPRTGIFSRILIITPAKAGSAPQRNLIRRRIKALFYENELYKSSYDWIIFVKKGACNYSFSDLKRNILEWIADSKIV